MRSKVHPVQLCILFFQKYPKYTKISVYLITIYFPLTLIFKSIELLVHVSTNKFSIMILINACDFKFPAAAVEEDGHAQGGDVSI